MLYEYNRLGVEMLIHEAGAGQMEINFTHGDPLELAGRVFLFKRAVRGTALRHGIAFCAVKELEYGTCHRVISSREREHLLLLV